MSSVPSTAPADPAVPAGRGILVLGDARVDLVAERHVPSPRDVAEMTPHLGGFPAAVAQRLAVAGRTVTLAGGAGADDWGAWLAERLHDDGVDTFHFRLNHGTATPLALVTVAPDASPTATLYADTGSRLAEALGASVKRTVTEHAALLISSGTLVDARERELTMAAREAALDASVALILAPDLDLRRWSTRADAAATTNACVPGALLVLLEAAEAELLTGESDTERAAVALRKAGAANVVIIEPDGTALLRGRIRADAWAPETPPPASTLGRGAAMLASLLDALMTSDFYEPSLAAGLRAAVAAGAHAGTHWGAVD